MDRLFALFASLVLFAFLSPLRAAEAPVEPSTFGMHILHPGDYPAPFPFGTLRLWDAGTPWKKMNPAPGQYDFSVLDHWLDLAARNHWDVVYTFGHTPPWAAREGNEAMPPADLRAWDDFVRALATHAAGRIQYWEMWNEPTLPRFFQGSPAELAEMTRRAAAIIKSIDPSARILGASPVGEEKITPWLDAYFAAGAGSAIDIVAFHGYLRRKPPEQILKLLQSIRGTMSAHQIGNKPLWDTEASWGEEKDLPDPEAQAAYLARYYLLQRSHRVDRFIWYAWHETGFGALKDAGGPRQAATAYAQMYQWLVGAAFEQPCAGNGHRLWRCEVSRPGGYRAQIVWDLDPDVSYTPPTAFRQYRTLDGRTGPIDGPVRIGPQPVLLETGMAPAS